MNQTGNVSGVDIPITPNKMKTPSRLKSKRPLNSSTSSNYNHRAAPQSCPEDETNRTDAEPASPPLPTLLMFEEIKENTFPRSSSRLHDGALLSSSSPCPNLTNDAMQSSSKKKRSYDSDGDKRNNAENLGHREQVFYNSKKIMRHEPSALLSVDGMNNSSDNFKLHHDNDRRDYLPLLNAKRKQRKLMKEAPPNLKKKLNFEELTLSPPSNQDIDGEMILKSPPLLPDLDKNNGDSRESTGKGMFKKDIYAITSTVNNNNHLSIPEDIFHTILCHKTEQTQDAITVSNDEIKSPSLHSSSTLPSMDDEDQESTKIGGLFLNANKPDMRIGSVGGKNGDLLSVSADDRKFEQSNNRDTRMHFTSENSLLFSPPRRRVISLGPRPEKIRNNYNHQCETLLSHTSSPFYCSLREEENPSTQRKETDQIEMISDYCDASYHFSPKQSNPNRALKNTRDIECKSSGRVVNCDLDTSKAVTLTPCSYQVKNRCRSFDLQTPKTIESSFSSSQNGRVYMTPYWSKEVSINPFSPLPPEHLYSECKNGISDFPESSPYHSPMRTDASIAGSPIRVRRRNKTFYPRYESTRDEINSDFLNPLSVPSFPSSPNQVTKDPQPAEVTGISNYDDNQEYQTSSPKKCKGLPPMTPSKQRITVSQLGTQDRSTAIAVCRHCNSPITVNDSPHLRSFNESIQLQTSRFESDFQSLATLGDGSYGRVYKAISRLDGCLYAIKVTKRTIRGEADKHNVLKEVHALAALCNKAEKGTFHIVRYHQAWMEEGHLYIQTELCEETLSAEVTRIKSSDRERKSEILEKRMWKMLRELLLALEFIHRNDMVHLDIKPENIFVKDDIYKLGDFGLASKVSGSHNDIQEGDSRYMSKEMLSNKLRDLKKCDIFSLGATLYEVCLQRPLPPGGQEWHDIRSGRLLTFPSKEISSELKTTISQMIHPDPQLRPNAQELLQRRCLLSSEQQELLIEKNKAREASIALAVHELKLKEFSINSMN